MLFYGGGGGGGGGGTLSMPHVQDVGMVNGLVTPS